MFHDIYKNKKVVVTGHTGFKGAWLSCWLYNLGAKVTGIALPPATTPSLFATLNIQDKINHIEQDIRDNIALNKIIQAEQPDFVFHLAAQSLVANSYKNPQETITTNVQGTTNILDALRELNRECVAVIITSDKCYHNLGWEWGYRENDILGGDDIYSASKAAAEIIFNAYAKSFFKKNSKVRLATARAGNVIGGGDWAANRIVPDCIQAWSNNQAVDIRHPEFTRPWQHVLEPLSGYLHLGYCLAEQEHIHGNAFNFGPRSEQNRTVLALVKDLYSYFESSVLKSAYNINRNEEFSEAMLLKLNCDKALLSLDWQPALDYLKTIDFVGKWYQEFYKHSMDMLNFTLGQIKLFEQQASINKLVWAKNNVS